MFERFTEKAIKVIMLAQEEARRLSHNLVGTEQVLLGLIGEGKGIAAKTLKSEGINLKDARAEVEKIIGRGSGFVAVEIPFTPRVKRVLEHAWDEARQLGHNYIGTEHLLLGIIRENEGVATRVLEVLNVDLKHLRSEIIKHIEQAAQERNPTEQKQQESNIEELDNNIASDVFRSLPIQIRTITCELGQVVHDKEMAIRNQEFEKAAGLRERQVELDEQLKAFFTEEPRVKAEDTKFPEIDKLSDSVLKVILLAREECRRLGHNTVGSEQILLGLISENGGITSKVFQSAGIDLDKAREAVKHIIGKDSHTKATYLALTPRAQKILLAAHKIAKQYGLIYIKKEHLLLALISEEEGVAARTLQNLGANIDKMKEETIKLINDQNPNA